MWTFLIASKNPELERFCREHTVFSENRGFSFFCLLPKVYEEVKVVPLVERTAVSLKSSRQGPSDVIGRQFLIFSTILLGFEMLFSGKKW